MTRTEISNSDDVIDSRDVIARIEELESLIEDEEISEDNGATAQHDENENVIEDWATCGTCGKTWNDALISGSTPAPSGRCPYESIHDEIEESGKLKALADQCEGYGDWSHGETLIRESYFVEYCQNLVSDIGDMPREIPGYIVIDWEATAKNLEADYMTVDFDGVNYLMRA